MAGKGNAIITAEMLELVESDIHGVVQAELAELKACVPDIEERQKYFKKNPGVYYRAFNDLINTEQKIKAGGYGNPTAKNLTINLNGLGLRDKQKLLAEMIGDVQKIGEKMGYSEELVEAEVIPVEAGKNRMRDDDKEAD
jgi:hypothetical protein